MRNLQKESSVIKTLSDPIVSALTQVSVFSLVKGLLRASHETELDPFRWNELVL